MLEPNPEKRLSTEEIAQEKWYKEGDFASEQELADFFT